MKNLLPFLLAILLHHHVGLSQNILESDREQMLTPSYYEMTSQLFEEQELVYDFKAYDKEVEFSDKILSQERISSLLDQISQDISLKTYEMKMKDITMQGIYIAFSLPTGNNLDLVEQLYHRVQVYLHDLEIVDKKGEKVEIKFVKSGTSIIDEGTDLRISFDFRITEEVENLSSLCGSLNAEFLFLSEFEKYEISKENIGDTLDFEGKPSILKDIFYNKIVVKNLFPNDLKNLPNFTMLALTNDGKNKYVMKKLHIGGPEATKQVRTKPSSGFASMTIPVPIYDLFKSKADISLEDYKEALSQEPLNNFNDIYTVYQNPAITKRAIIYRPVFESKIVFQLYL